MRRARDRAPAAARRRATSTRAASSRRARAAARRSSRAPIPEDAPADPRNVYAATKLHQEHLASAFARETGVPVTALRYHNVYGPRMPRDTPVRRRRVASSPSALAAGRAPARVRGRRPAARLRPRARRRARERARADAPPSRPGRVQRLQRDAAQRRRDGARAARGRERPAPPPGVTGAVPPRRRAPRLRRPRSGARTARLRRARSDFDAGIAEFARASCAVVSPS